ncbi:hypothetical protein A3850_017805 [Lewinella sp. 4G2]|nr:hypothetical protein A3850_017805 [Lewinella sp. 4G2]
MILLVLVALGADWIANDRPIAASVEGEIRFPVAADVLRQIGFGSNSLTLTTDWYQAKTDWALWPPIPYDGVRSDLTNGGFLSPFAAQDTGERARHLLGTDRLGRDVAAGLVYGTRVALFVGVGAVFIGLLLGISLGSIGGFFGNRGLRLRWSRLIGFACGLLVGSVYSITALAPYVQLENPLFIGLFALAVSGLLGILLSWLFNQFSRLREPVALPTDSVVLQLIEIFVNIPGLIFLLAVLSLAPQPSIGLLAAVTGVLSWPTIARFTRAELLRIRSLPYIRTALGNGISPWRVLTHHALPNAFGPLLVVVAFTAGSAILAEGFLSFLGIGLPNDVATWGTLLRRSREQPLAWWLAIFPGLMITLTVLAVQVLGGRRE